MSYGTGSACGGEDTAGGQGRGSGGLGAHRGGEVDIEQEVLSGEGEGGLEGREGVGRADCSGRGRV